MFISKNIIHRGRFYVLSGIIMLLFLVLLGRFYYLQIYQHQKYASRADANRIREVSQQAPRGLIFDRYGTLLVDNRFSYMMSAIPWELRRSPEVLEHVSRYVEPSPNELRSRIQEDYRGAFIPVRLMTGLDFPTISILEEHRLDLPGIVLSYEPIRYYPADLLMSHALGYLREIDQSQLNRLKRGERYKPGDVRGKSGIEEEYEHILRGSKGYKYVQVNAIGQEVGPVEDREPILPKPGQNLHLSIDAQLQAYTESLFDTLRGAAVVLNPHNGEIHTFVSAPAYNLDLFSGSIDPEDWQRLQADTTRPLFNRAAVGTYPPGSTFKLITAIAALEENVISPEWTATCPGYYRLGRRIFRCWKGGGHGRLDLFGAIEQSCNVYFYKLIREVGIDHWARYAELFDFGERTGVDLPEESSGILPNRYWMDTRYGKKRWTEGHLLNMTVGQGNLLVTPLQMAHFAGMIATAGHDVTPHFGVSYETPGGNLQKIQYPETQLTEVDSSTYRVIMDALYRVVNGDHGTARAARVRNAMVFGKTGTSQNPHGEDHAWFIGILRDDSSVLSLSVLVENGGSGGAIAAPIAGKIFEKYMELQEQRQGNGDSSLLTERGNR